MYAPFKRAARFTFAAFVILSSACADHSPTSPLTPPPAPPPSAPTTPTSEELNAVDIVYGTDAGLVALKADGAERAQLASGDFRKMAISPDGNRVAFIRNSNLYVSNVDGSALEQLAIAVIDRPAWSPDQTRLVFARTDGLYIIEVASLKERQVTRVKNFVTDVQASWSPDGKRIAFTRDDFSSSDEIRTLNTNEGSPSELPATTLFNIGADAWSPVWSGDGTQLAVVIMGGISVLKSDGSGSAGMRLTSSAGFINEINDWSSDGKWVAFTLWLPGRSDTYVGDFAGRTARINGSESWGAVALRKAARTAQPPSFLEPAVFIGPRELYSFSGSIWDSIYILYPDGKFTFRLVGPTTLSFTGKRTATDSGFIFDFDGNPGVWRATVTLDNNKLIVHYNTSMLFSDFIDGTYTYSRGAVP